MEKKKANQRKPKPKPNNSNKKAFNIAEYQYQSTVNQFMSDRTWDSLRGSKEKNFTLITAFIFPPVSEGYSLKNMNVMNGWHL